MSVKKVLCIILAFVMVLSLAACSGELSEEKSESTVVQEATHTPETVAPTKAPTEKPTEKATEKPTEKPTENPTEKPEEPKDTPANVDNAPADDNADNGGGGSAQNYILNTNTHKFHYPDCGSVKKMADKNKEEFYGTREEAIDAGYTPCGKCNP